MDFQVTCINKVIRFDPRSAITHLGGTGPNGPWRNTQENVIAAIKAGHRFYVARLGHVVFLQIRISPFGNEYVKTEADADTPDNLLHLPECQ